MLEPFHFYSLAFLAKIAFQRTWRAVAESWRVIVLAESQQTIYARPVWSADDLTVNAGANCETGSTTKILSAWGFNLME